LEGALDWRAGTGMTDAEFRSALRLRLGLPCGRTGICACGAAMDADGDHALSCWAPNGRAWRHSAINTALQRAFARAGVLAFLEPRGLVERSDRRPDGVADAPWLEERRLAWDATCVHPAAASNLVNATAAAAGAARAAETAKRTKYSAIVPDCVFTPVGIETFGRFGPGALRLVRRLGRCVARSTSDPRASFDLCRRLSVAVQRGNARCLGWSAEGARSP
jgi:hypothetical protein